MNHEEHGKDVYHDPTCISDRRYVICTTLTQHLEETPHEENQKATGATENSFKAHLFNRPVLPSLVGVEQQRAEDCEVLDHRRRKLPNVYRRS